MEYAQLGQVFGKSLCLPLQVKKPVLSANGKTGFFTCSFIFLYPVIKRAVPHHIHIFTTEHG